MTPDQIRGMLYGLAVGDALGVPYEFKARGMFRCKGMTGYGTHDQPAGTWSDDTAMALATLHSLIENGWQVKPSDLLARYRDWLDDGAYTPDGVVFDYGLTCATAIRSGHGLTEERSQGNGSLMRIAPLAIRHQSDESIRAASAVTHAHPHVMDTCVRQVRMLERLADGWTPDLDPRTEEAIRSGGFVDDTADAALWCLSNTNSYGDCVLTAVNLGEDTDTTACVAGAMAGVRYGYGAIPVEWLKALRGAPIIESLVDAVLLDNVGVQSTSGACSA